MKLLPSQFRILIRLKNYLLLAIMFLPCAAFAQPSCGFFDKKFKLADGVSICLKDVPFFNRTGLISNEPNSSFASKAQQSSSFAVAASSDPKSCPLATFIAWDWGYGRDAAEALPKCNERLKEAVKTYGKFDSKVECVCEVLVDSSITSKLTKQAFYERIENLNKQIGIGGRPLYLAETKIVTENKKPHWTDRIVKETGTLLKSWLEESSYVAIAEVPAPIYPLALKIEQDKWESNKEFEDRVALLRAERQKQIERIQSEYKSKVEMRNNEIQKLTLLRAEKEKQLPAFKVGLIKQALNNLNLKVEPKSSTFDPDRSILYVDVTIDGENLERYEFKGTSIQVRREAITSTVNLKLKPEFFVTDSGQFGIKAMNLEFSGAKVSGNPSLTHAGSQTLRLATIDVPMTNMPELAQQSALTVDRNQVEQILYRDENESLRKRLEEQRKTQELLLAEEIKKASTETAKLRAEAEIARNRQRELELQLASTSRAPVNYGKALNAHALVIGNSAYAGSSKLLNPVNDAHSMSSKLQGLGFTVTKTLDTNRTSLVNALSQFASSAASADLTLLFYAGHGVQITGTNYMLPIDLNLNDLTQAPLQGISLNDVVEKYLPGKTKLVFLDACRDNPLMQVASRGVSRGLAPINVSEGTLISYATKDGSVAQDGDGKNSPFTSALLEHIGDPDDIAVVLRKVREKVMKTTGNKQQPWEYGSLTGGTLILSAIKPK